METMEQQVRKGAEALHLSMSEEALGLLARHARLVLAANETMSLTTISEDQFAGLHILDSLAALPYLDSAPDGAFADLGTGAGYPGIPLAIASGRPVVLVESVRKKAAFLQAAAAELCLKATVHPIRAEELALTSAGSFVAVVARALSALPSLVELAAPLLVEGGLLICLKGAPAPAELERGDRAALRCGMKRVCSEEISVPFVEGQRTIVVFRRSGRASVRLPRRPGMAQRQPLA
jgi:16S rRNA (guanine527-N7)-methyltransferase